MPLHNIKIRINEFGKGEVVLDDKPLMTLGTTVETNAGSMPRVTIYTVADTLEQEITTGDLTIRKLEPDLRIWRIEDAPDAYKNLSSSTWRWAYVMRWPMKMVFPGLHPSFLALMNPDESPDYRREMFDHDGYAVVIFGMQ